MIHNSVVVQIECESIARPLSHQFHNIKEQTPQEVLQHAANVNPMALQRIETKGWAYVIDPIEECALGQRVMISGVDVCKEMTISWWSVDRKMVFQLRDGVDGPSLHHTINVFTPFGMLHARELENSYPKAMAIHIIANIGRHDVDCWVKAIKSGDSKFTQSHQCEKGDGETGSHGCIKQILGVEFGEQSFDESQGEGLLLGMFWGWWHQIGSSIVDWPWSSSVQVQALFSWTQTLTIGFGPADWWTWIE